MALFFTKSIPTVCDPVELALAYHTHICQSLHDEYYVCTSNSSVSVMEKQD